MRSVWMSLIILCCLSCTTQKVVQPDRQVGEKAVDTSICENKAILLDYTSAENCGYLFQLTDGTKLLPSFMPETDIPFINGSAVFIGYKTYDGEKTKTKSLCGQEDKIVEIVCIRKYEDPNGSKPKTHDECEPVKNVFLSSWMSKVSQELKPQKISEYDYSVGYLYSFNVNGIDHLYDCLGNKMCSSDDGGDCKSLMATLGKGKVIQVLRN